MYKTLLVMLLAVMSSSVMAEWTEVVIPSDPVFSKGRTVYVDLTTIHKTRNRAKMWHLEDFESVSGLREGHYSMKSQREYDCKKEQSRILNTMLFKGNMGLGGAYSLQSDISDWEPVANPVAKTLWKIVCGN